MQTPSELDLALADAGGADAAPEYGARLRQLLLGELARGTGAKLDEAGAQGAKRLIVPAVAPARGRSDRCCCRLHPSCVPSLRRRPSRGGALPRVRRGLPRGGGPSRRAARARARAGAAVRRRTDWSFLAPKFLARESCWAAYYAREGRLDDAALGIDSLARARRPPPAGRRAPAGGPVPADRLESYPLGGCPRARTGRAVQCSTRRLIEASEL